MEVARLIVVVVQCRLASPIQQLVVDGEVVLDMMELSVALLVNVHLRHPVVGFVSCYVTTGGYRFIIQNIRTVLLPGALTEL